MSQTAIADARLKAYTELLVRYNGSLNLLSAQGLRDIQRLLADGKGYARVIEELAGPLATVVDVGSGAGFPGMVIAAMMPQANVILVERRRRRAAFLELAVGGTGLENTRVYSGDVRRLRDVRAHVITAQAVTTLSDLAALTRHLHRDVCFLISRRGPGWREDLSAVETVLDGASHQPTETEARPGSRDSAHAESHPAMTVVAEKDLDQSGSLVALRLTGGPACRSSG